MSASLVGSEMCIRDSNCRGCSGPPSTPCCRRGAPGRRTATGGSSGRWGCLLYTSDAADDM
eukprot:7742315-Alexandrium_andersonii.AAC.1